MTSGSSATKIRLLLASALDNVDVLREGDSPDLTVGIDLVLDHSVLRASAEAALKEDEAGIHWLRVMWDPQPWLAVFGSSCCLC